MQVTKSEFFSELTRVSKLIEGTDLDIKELIKYEGRLITRDLLLTDITEGLLSKYTFALALVEGKPVFAGDKLWHIGLEQIVTIVGAAKTERYLQIENDTYYSAGIDRLLWNKPKKTFMLNGEELPLPDSVMPRENFNIYYVTDSFIDSIKLFQWNESTDRDKVEAAILKLLSNE